MVSTPVLFDTNILIDYLSAYPQARIELDTHSDRAISIITWMEVLAGASANDAEETRAFLLNFHTIPLSTEIADRAVKIRQTRRIKLPDAIIQATAEASGRTLVSRNTRDFPKGMAGVRTPYTR